MIAWANPAAAAQAPAPFRAPAQLILTGAPVRVGANIGALPPFVRPSAMAARIDTSEAPVIDGDLSDTAWSKATVLADFLQQLPVPGAPAMEPTVLRIMYDENNLYFGVYAYDSRPEEIILRPMEHDPGRFAGDNVTIVLDPGTTRRNAYRFRIMTSGGFQDQLILNNAQNLNEWDPIWTVRTRLVADGWIAEFAIPFRSLSYDPSQTEWGFEFIRFVQRTNEDTRWSSHNPAIDFRDISQAGTLTGITNINPGVGLDVQIYGATQVKRDWHIPGEDTGISFTAGGNAFYKITPALTGTLTINPDFSDRPLDARQINTTRFSLFFPETRDFFLQDAAAFEFGGRGFVRGFDTAVINGRTFFSRNIGLARREPVGVVGGVKLSGQYGGFDVGALSVLTADTPTEQGQVLSVARVTRPVLSESKFGFIVTHGDPTGATDNTVVGADFQYRDSNFFPGQIFQSDFYYERSISSTLGEDEAFGVALNFPNEPWGGFLDFKEVGANFMPALGFVNRPGIRFYDSNLVHTTRYRNSFLRALGVGTNHRFITTLNDVLESRESTLFVQAETSGTDMLTVRLLNIYEAVPRVFLLPDNIPVPVGKYEWTNFNLSLETSGGRRVSAIVGITCCSFYDGSTLQTNLQLSYRPSIYLQLEAGWALTRLDLPRGDTDVHVLTAGSLITFTPYMSLVIEAQYDNISQDFGLLARYRWEFVPGDELFVSLGQGATIGDSRFTAERSLFSVRLSHTFRF
jgi:Carbohydrate family 9 binding domain-like